MDWRALAVHFTHLTVWSSSVALDCNKAFNSSFLYVDSYCFWAWPGWKLMSLAELMGFLTQIQHWSQPLPTATVARCPWYPSSRAWNTLSLSSLLWQSRTVMARSSIPSVATRRSSSIPRNIHELTKIQSKLHLVDWCWSGCTFLRTLGSKLWLYSNVVCHLVHLEQHATCHKRHVGNTRSHLVSIYRKQEPILHKKREHTRVVS